MENYALEEYQAQVDDSVSYQVYNNLDRQENTDLAVDSTAGQIMTFEGEPITAVFFLNLLRLYKYGRGVER